MERYLTEYVGSVRREKRPRFRSGLCGFHLHDERQRRRCRGVEEVAHSEPVRLEAGFMLIWRSVQWAVVFNSRFPYVERIFSAEKKEKRQHLLERDGERIAGNVISQKNVVLRRSLACNTYLPFYIYQNGQGMDGISLLWYRNVLFPSKVPCLKKKKKNHTLHPLFLTVPLSVCLFYLRAISAG